MKTYLQKFLSLLMILNFLCATAIADSVVTGAGNSYDTGDGKEYGVSSGYNTSGTKKSIQERSKARVKTLKKARKELKKDLRKAKGKEAKNLVKEKLKKVALEIGKNLEESEFEDDLYEHPAKPQRNPERDNWKRKKRIARKAAKEKLQKEIEERRQGETQSSTDLRNLGTIDMDEISSTNRDVIDGMSDVSSNQRDFDHAGCIENSEEPTEICVELRSQIVEAELSLQQSESRFHSLTRKLPAILLASGGIYLVGRGLGKLQKLFKRYLNRQRDYQNCYENCEEMGLSVEESWEEVEAEQLIQQSSITEIQNDWKKAELEGQEVTAKLVVPNYLSEKISVPFSNSDVIPLIFGIESQFEYSAFSKLEVLVNGEKVPTSFYSEEGVIIGHYSGYSDKEKFIGKVILTSIDGSIFQTSFKGHINLKKPVVTIEKKSGSLLRKAKFLVEVKGDFNKISISGINVKEKELAFDSIQNYQKLKVKTLSRGDATIKVNATLTTKVANSGPLFDGPLFETTEEGYINHPLEDFFPALDFFRTTPKSNNGYCCNGMTKKGKCSGCSKSYTTKKGCKFLNKHRGKKFKFHFNTRTLKCEAL
ncbi:MAG: hypothetical protein HN509_03470 [Halobacteriovoraceae bacterium]|jgi:hypothetical protein|nr:hypothetical protein [Halobacteriovoraceae bacterium]MBT5093225.1 hypothetical protein [Halobacteriovoraceae bacterium]